VAQLILKQKLRDLKEKDANMAEYKIVKYCRMCRKRFVVNKGQSKIYYCEECQNKVNQTQEE